MSFKEHPGAFLRNPNFCPLKLLYRKFIVLQSDSTN